MTRRTCSRRTYVSVSPTSTRRAASALRPSDTLALLLPALSNEFQRVGRRQLGVLVDDTRPRPPFYPEHIPSFSPGSHIPSPVTSCSRIKIPVSLLLATMVQRLLIISYKSSSNLLTRQRESWTRVLPNLATSIWFYFKDLR